MQSDSSESMPAFNTILLGYVGVESSNPYKSLHPSGTKRTLKLEKTKSRAPLACILWKRRGRIKTPGIKEKEHLHVFHPSLIINTKHHERFTQSCAVRKKLGGRLSRTR